ncbi:methyl-accepting chemotaxis protein [uncultured Aliivibrio sp.]|uniref:methyl-accepting chemotaxis protein n=1 Tax=uncultured Aliivibrio sp. TaxID=873085 RepID=UPI002627C329|nr:methyl-accepting chemotaxis protein [uncultured Aliivibrio sp.]
MKNYSLKKKILFITILSLLSVISLLSWQSYSKQKMLEHETATRQLARLADVHSKKIEEWMNFRISIVDGLSNYVSDNEELLYLAEEAGNFLISYYTYYDGRLLTSDPNLDVTGLDLRDADWYIDAQKQSDILVTSPYFEPILKDTVVTIAKSTKDAVVASDLSISILIKQVAGMALPDNGEAILVDSEGKIIAYTDAELVQQPLSKLSSQLDLNKVEQASKNKQLTQVMFDRQQKEKLLWAINIPNIDWTLVLAIDKETLEAPLKEQLINQLIGAGVVLVISILAMAYIMSIMFAPLLRITAALAEIANGNGDLTQRLKIESHDEIGELANSFNVFTESQHMLICHINKQSIDLEQDATNSLENSKSTMISLEDQQENLISVATAMNQMSGAASDIAMNAAQTATAAHQSTKSSEEGLVLASSTRQSVQQLASEVSNTTNVISELNDHVNSISGILVTIQGIAEQTNLLALNAAIEAARAGEQGRGFAVVADEVRILSKRTQDSTQEIYMMIDSLQHSTGRVVDAMKSNQKTVEGTVNDIDHLAMSLNESTQAIALISDMATQIATAAEEQSQVIIEMNGNTMTIKETSEDIMISAQSSLNQAEELKIHADLLNQQVSKFKI